MLKHSWTSENAEKFISQVLHESSKESPSSQENPGEVQENPSSETLLNGVPCQESSLDSYQFLSGWRTYAFEQFSQGKSIPDLTQEFEKAGWDYRDALTFLSGVDGERKGIPENYMHPAMYMGTLRRRTG